MELSSPAFRQGQPIPAGFTCDGDDRSPTLAWSGAPTETRSFALLCEDPDAPRGMWVHWVLFNLPADAVELEEGVPPLPELPSGARQGANDWSRPGYGGPCPPPGNPHRYFFRLYALDALLNLAPGATRADLQTAMSGHVLADTSLMGTYQRRAH
jgi:Raf kinase inhibitor-like YbhB/YbcL family protein